MKDLYHLTETSINWENLISLINKNNSILLNYLKHQENEAKRLLISYYKSQNTYCKDQIWLGSRIGMDLSPNNPNKKFIECGRES